MDDAKVEVGDEHVHGVPERGRGPAAMEGLPPAVHVVVSLSLGGREWFFFFFFFIVAVVVVVIHGCDDDDGDGRR